MKRIKMLGTAILAGVLVPACLAQTDKEMKSHTKQEKKAEKARVKAEKKAGKKTTSSQDAAYAAAYLKGIPQGQSAPK